MRIILLYAPEQQLRIKCTRIIIIIIRLYFDTELIKTTYSNHTLLTHIIITTSVIYSHTNNYCN